MSENFRTYRHKVTGLIGSYTKDLGAELSDVLEEVAYDAPALIPTGEPIDTEGEESAGEQGDSEIDEKDQK